MTDEFVKLLDQGCADLGIELSDQQKEQFFKYYEMLIEKNKVMNLTAITELSDVITKHFVDSSAITSSCFHIHENKKPGGSTIC